MSATAAGRDALGRRRRLQPTSTGKRLTLQERDWLWLRVLHEHGPLPSSFLLAFAKDYGVSEKRAKERLTDLFNEENTAHGGSYLARPPQQFQTLDSRYNQLVYDVSPAGKRALKARGWWHSTNATSGGPWWHRLMVSSITASIRLGAAETPHLSYIPQADILERAQAELSYPVSISEPSSGRMIRKALKPDALFGLTYQTEAGPRYRFFVVEADRSTEPYTSKNFNRKSALLNYLQYREYVGRGLYKQHLKLTSPLLVLNVHIDERRVESIQRIISIQAGGENSYQLFQAWDMFSNPAKPPEPNTALIFSYWQRVCMPALTIGSIVAGV